MNELPGIETYSSCGGHRGDLELSQVPEGRWYVHFLAEPTQRGWDALRVLAQVVQVASVSTGSFTDNTGEGAAVALELFVDDQGALAVELRGRDTDATDVAATIQCLATKA